MITAVNILLNFIFHFSQKCPWCICQLFCISKVVFGTQSYTSNILYPFYPLFLVCFIIMECIRSVAQSCPTLCDLMNRSTPGLPVHHQLPEFTQTHIHRVSDGCHPAISSSVVPFSSCSQSLPASESFPMSQLFT